MQVLEAILETLEQFVEVVLLGLDLADVDVGLGTADVPQLAGRSRRAAAARAL